MKQLIGGVIFDAGVVEEDGNLWLFVQVQKGAEQFNCIVLRDAEGNGPGHLHVTSIQPIQQAR